MRRLLWLVLVVCLLALPSWARERAWGWCTSGGVRVYVSNVGSAALPPSFAATYFQQSYPNCTVTVYLTGTNTLATLYSDNSSTPLANPFTASSNGYWAFYADAGRYDVRFSGAASGISTPFSIGDIELCDFQSETCSVGGGGGGSTPHNLLSATHPDTVPYTPPVPGDQILGGLPTGQKWQRFAGNTATTRKVLSQVGDGTNVTSQDWLQIGGDCGSLPIVKLDPNTGAVTCGAAASNATYQHNDTTVATQPILDIKDSGNISWTISNDSANNRVTAVATADTTPSCNLTQQVDWYVSPAGSDSNNGSVGSPWLTIQHAIDAGVPAIVCGRYIIHLATGTYAENVNVLGRVFAGNVNPNIGSSNNTFWPFSQDAGGGITDNSWQYSWIEILGSTAAPASYLLDGGGSRQTIAINNANVAFRGVKITNTNNVGIAANGNSVINLAGDIFGECQTCVDLGYGARLHFDHSGTVNDDTVTLVSFAPTLSAQHSIYLHDGAFMDDADWVDSGTVGGAVLDFNLIGTSSAVHAIRVKSGSKVHLYASVNCTIKSSQQCFDIEGGDAEISGMTITGSSGLVIANSVSENGSLTSTGIGTWTIDNATQGVRLSENSTTTVLPTGTSLTNPLYYVSMINNPADGGIGNTAYVSAPTQSSLIMQTETVTFNSTVAFDMYLGGTKMMTLTANSALSAVTHNSDGQLLQTILCQDSAGGHTFSFPVTFVNPPTISSAPSTCTINQFVYLRLTNSWYTAGGGSGSGSSGFAFLGAWSSATAYSVDNIVTYNGSSYIALSANSNVTPGSDGGVTWAVLAAAGAQGPAGPSGASGTNGTDGAPGAPGYSPNQVLSGCGVAYSSGLSFTVSACSYIIQNVQYGSPLTTVTLTAADPSLDRIDAIVVNSSGAATYITGTPAATPAPPSVDIATQLQLTFVYVAAGATTPSNITTTDLYHENAEWTCASSANVNCNSTSNPHSGSKDIEATTATTPNYARLTIPSGTIDISQSNNLVFWIRSKATWASTRSLTLQWYNGNTAKCTPVALADGNFGFSSSLSGSYQQIVVPTYLFSCAGIPVTRIQFTVAGSGTTIGFYLDDVILQGGVPSSSGSAAMNWRGAWANSTTYQVNDTVTYGGSTYTAIQTNTNQIPSGAPTYWTVHDTHSPAGVVNNIQINAGSGQFGALNTSIDGSSNVTFPAGVYATKFVSTDTVNNTAVTFTTGSGGDATCPTPVAGTSFLCMKSSSVSVSQNGGAYSAIGTGGTVTTTGTPASGNLSAFSGATSITNTDLTGAVTTSGTVATTLASRYVIRDCEIAIGDPGTASPVLADDNDSPAVCQNDLGADYTITAVSCYADAGTPSVNPILTGGAATSILSSALTCGTATFAAGTVNGTPTVHTFSADGATCASTPCSLDANIATAGGTAKYVVIKIKYSVAAP